MDLVPDMLVRSSVGHITLGEREQNGCAGTSGASGPAMQLSPLDDGLLPTPINSLSDAVAGYVSGAVST